MESNVRLMLGRIVGECDTNIHPYEYSRTTIDERPGKTEQCERL
jgi:hypothetical protein